MVGAGLGGCESLHKLTSAVSSMAGLTEFMFTRQVASIVGSVMNGEPTSVQAAKVRFTASATQTGIAVTVCFNFATGHR